MKSLSAKTNGHTQLTELTHQELLSIEGGSTFWEDFFYAVGVTVKSVYVFTKTAAEFQHSLPSNLKK